MDNEYLLLKENLFKELKLFFGNDVRRINHSKEVTAYAEDLLHKESADASIVIPAAVLHDVGIKIAEEKYNSDAARYQEKEGPAVAGKILSKLNFNHEDRDEICEIITHHHSPGIINTVNFKVLYDADWLVNLKDEIKTRDSKKLKKLIDRIFLTVSGKETAEKKYLQQK
ncbi:MAG: HD domain-containing protein [Actinobacteria bacterium]|nr:HD domain-containing protein [Actinomycetota bacterium]